MAWHAELEDKPVLGLSSRRTIRRHVHLSTAASEGGRRLDVLVHDLSQTGTLIETPMDIAIGETIGIDLPESGLTACRVVWRSGAFHGCQFDRPIPLAAVSASRLRSPAEPAGAADMELSPAALKLHPAARFATIAGVSLILWGCIAIALLLS